MSVGAAATTAAPPVAPGVLSRRASSTLADVERIGLVVHEGRPAAVEAAARVRAWASERGVPLRDVDVWGTPHTPAVERRHARDEAEASGHPDLVVTIGGDGTFLRGARVAAQDGAAVLGVDVGRVGFLTEVSTAELEAALDAVAEGRAIIEERLTLGMRASRPLELPTGMDGLLRFGRGTLPPPTARRVGADAGGGPPPAAGRGDGRSDGGGDADGDGWGVALDVTAINDVVFEKLARDRQASLGMYIGERLFASYSADALIVATPTGSTAYSFSAGGPVLSPRLRALVFTPVAPHMVFDRSLVVADDEVVAVRVLDASGQVAVSVDGQLRGVLDPGDWVAVHAGDRPARLVRLRPSDFYGRLRERFKLADAPAALADGAPPAVYRPAAPPPADVARFLHPR